MKRFDLLAGTLAVVALLILTGAAHGQIRMPGRPASDWADLPAEIPTVVMDRPDIEGLMADDAARGHWPLRYGAVIETELAYDRLGRWDEVAEDGSFVWRIRVHSPGAHTLGIVFDEYEIPVGGQVFLYDEARTEVHGAYTDFHNNSSGALAIEPVTGDTVVVEYVQQSWVTEDLRLRIGQVVHDYRNLHRRDSWEVGISSGPPPACLTGINCPPGDGYQDVKRSVVRISVLGGFCSGAILNNTAQDETPYVLTATHCGDMSLAIFLFNFEDSTCDGDDAAVVQTVSGSTLLASSGGPSPGQDSQLLLLNTPVPSSYHPYYAGWDRTTVAPAPAVAITHGAALPKQIAIDSSGVVISLQTWQAQWETGIILGGSSGGPLFNGDKRVIGPTSWVTTFTCFAQRAHFGRFDRFWTTQGLDPWLDPLATGVTFLDGLDVPGGPMGITGVTPALVPAIDPGTSQDVTIDGFGFSPLTRVIVDGIHLSTLSPPPFTVVSDTQITLDPPLLPQLGPVTLEVREGPLTATDTLTIVANDPPAVEAGNGVEPVLVFSATGVDVTMGSNPGDIFFLAASPHLIPSVVPGFFSIEIGNGLLTLIPLLPFTIPAEGYVQVNLPLSLPPLTTFYLEGINIDPFFTLPLPDSNEQQVLQVF